MSTLEHFVFDEDQMIESLVRYGWADEMRSGDGELARVQALARRQLARWCQEGLPHRLAGGRRLFDHVQALNFVTRRGVDRVDSFWHEHVVAPRRREAEAGRARGSQSARYHDPRPAKLWFRREAFFPDRAPGSKLLLSVPIPAEEPTQRSVTATPRTPGVTLDPTSNLALLRATLGADHAVVLDLEIDFIAYQHTIEIDPRQVRDLDRSDPALAPFLEPDEGPVQVTPFIRGLTRQLTKSDAWGSLLAIWDFVFDELTIGSVYHHDLAQDDPLRSVVEGGWADCFWGSAVVTALCRACGIPARIVHGTPLWSLDLGPHYWAEAMIAPFGWVPLDLLSWVLSGGESVDPTWSRYLVGYRPYQLIWGRLPRRSVELGVRLPQHWCLVQTVASPRGQMNEFVDLDHGRTVYRDSYRFVLGGDVAPDQ